MSKDPKQQPPPAQDPSYVVFSVVIGGAIVVLVVMSFFAAKGREHLREIENDNRDPLQSGLYPDHAPGDNPGTASVMAIAPPEPEPSPSESQLNIDTAAIERPPFDMSRCEKWSQDARFDCEKFPDMPGECCLGC